ncbi:MAG: HAMP domain-containing protein, partial [Chloroflexi bacterium]|nr:HAMP domain-containing protein [Chloroflexota bacterium]
VTAIETALFASRDQLTALFGGMMIVVLFLGLWLANLIVKPLTALVNANKIVQKGELNIELPIISRDETGLLTESFNQMVEGLRDRDRIKNMFSQYVTGAVADAVLAGEVKLGGEQRVLSIMMTDIRNFTGLSESVGPDLLVEMINRYFEYMIDSIIEFEGILDKFIGDGILIEFNAPLYQNRHELRAICVALRMRQMLLVFNEDQVNLEKPTIRIGMGIHTGPCIVGNIGAEGKKVEYTALGDTVNVAARLESACKEVKSDMCISETLYGFVRDFIDVGPRQALALKGKSAIAKKVLDGVTDPLGDKFTELMIVEWGTAFYTAAPVKTEEGKLVGVILAGTTLERLLDRLSKEAQASLTVYDLKGKVVSTSLPLAEAVIEFQKGGPEPPILDVDQSVVDQVLSDKPSLVSRPISITGRTYRELTGALEVVHGKASLGFLGQAVEEALKGGPGEDHPDKFSLLGLHRGGGIERCSPLDDHELGELVAQRVGDA